MTKFFGAVSESVLWQRIFAVAMVLAITGLSVTTGLSRPRLRGRATSR